MKTTSNYEKQLTDGDLEMIKTAVRQTLDEWKYHGADLVGKEMKEQQIASWAALLEKLESL